MKNKKILFEYAFKPVIYFIISIVIGGSIIGVTYFILVDMYINSYAKIPQVIINVVNEFLYAKNNYIGDLIYIILILLISIPIYIIFMKKKIDSISEIINTTNIMANGDLNQTIQVVSKDEVGQLGNNINSIVSQLRNITIEERRAQQTKTDLITNVSHDLRTPLTSIIGYLGLIEDDRYKDEVELRYYTTIAYEKSKSLSILINDLFELTKMQNNTISLDKININLVELLGQIAEQFKYEFKQNNIKGRTDFSEDKLIINADANKLVRVFENLISNGIKYGKDGGYIDIVTRKQDNMAIVQIINYGEQIPSLDLPHIFEQFYRVEKSRNRNDGGSGLGLAIAKNIVELHGGNIKVESNSSRTIFEVKLKLI
ncbi:ATP-binding protein [Romboutsia sp. MSSM.1001216sp_RTP31141st1_G3_RTP31141_220114]|uniref:sensor histidine kinase n=1 Tax=unclassified Romboutsia TaxID=2626894 RepID=UPI0031B5C473